VSVMSPGRGPGCTRCSSEKGVPAGDWFRSAGAQCSGREAISIVRSGLNSRGRMGRARGDGRSDRLIRPDPGRRDARRSVSPGGRPEQQARSARIRRGTREPKGSVPRERARAIARSPRDAIETWPARSSKRRRRGWRSNLGRHCPGHAMLCIRRHHPLPTAFPRPPQGRSRPGESADGNRS
jgi:hypothetical protein